HLFGRNNGLIFPDFIGKNPNNRIIADAKYKPNKNIHGDDYLQLLAYLLRFDAKKGLYLYPYGENEEMKRIEEMWLNKGTTFEKEERGDDICVIKYGINIPRVNDFNLFVEQMEKEEKRITDYMLSSKAMN
ncbi:MAG: hypothetical protein IKX86_03300, partial [Clostridia bacterium]|nr:hypothetical protein [Clostridia bacterium]